MKDFIDAFKILGIMAIICIFIVLALAEPALRFAAMLKYLFGP